MTAISPPALLFVCLGNICRSPLVEAVARKRCAEAGLAVRVASCGTGNWHVGKGADPRMRQAAAAAGYDLSAHRARQVRAGDFLAHDWVLAMDRDNLDALARFRQAQGAAVELFLPWAGVRSPQEFPDPYFDGEQAFEQAVTLAEQGVDGLIARLRAG